MERNNAYEYEESNYVLQDAFEDGYKEIKDLLNKIFSDNQKKHAEGLHKLAETVKEDQLAVCHQTFTNDFSNNCIEGSCLLAFSKLIRFFPNPSFPTDKSFNDIADARLEGIKTACEAMHKMIDMFDEVAQTEEEKVCVKFLIKICEEIKAKSMGSSFEDWKQKNHVGWYLASREQDEQFFDEYCDYLEANGYHYDDLNIQN